MESNSTFTPVQFESAAVGRLRVVKGTFQSLSAPEDENHVLQVHCLQSGWDVTQYQNIIMSQWSWPLTLWIYNVLTSSFYLLRHLCTCSSYEWVTNITATFDLWTPNSHQIGLLFRVWRRSSGTSSHQCDRRAENTRQVGAARAPCLVAAARQGLNLVPDQVKPRAVDSCTRLLSAQTGGSSVVRAVNPVARDVLGSGET